MVKEDKLAAANCQPNQDSKPDCIRCSSLCPACHSEHYALAYHEAMEIWRSSGHKWREVPYWCSICHKVVFPARENARCILDALQYNEYHKAIQDHFEEIEQKKAFLEKLEHRLYLEYRRHNECAMKEEKEQCALS